MIIHTVGGIIYHKDFQSCTRTDSCVDKADSLLLGCKIKTFYLLANIYSWHECNADILLNSLTNLLSSRGKESAIYLSDVNIDVKVPTSISDKIYLDLISSHGFENLITIETSHRCS